MASHGGAALVLAADGRQPTGPAPDAPGQPCRDPAQLPAGEARRCASQDQQRDGEDGDQYQARPPWPEQLARWGPDHGADQPAGVAEAGQTGMAHAPLPRPSGQVDEATHGDHGAEAAERHPTKNWGGRPGSG